MNSPVGEFVALGSLGHLSLTESPRTDTLARQAYAAMRRAIGVGQLEPGRFYSEAQLAKVFGMSRTPVREALIELSREDAVERLPQRGFRLRIPTAKEIDEAYALRSLIEAYVVDRFVREADDGAVAQLMTLVNVQAAAIGTSLATPEIGYDFHLALPLTLGLRTSYRALLQMRASLWLSVRGQTVGDLRHTIEEHRQIAERLAARDAERAAALIQSHITHMAADALGHWAAVRAARG